METIPLFSEDSTTRRVSDAELTAIWDGCRRDGTVSNGCTIRELRKRYGDRVHHVMGDGWYVRPALEGK